MTDEPVNGTVAPKQPNWHRSQRKLRLGEEESWAKVLEAEPRFVWRETVFFLSALSLGERVGFCSRHTVTVPAAIYFSFCVPFARCSGRALVRKSVRHT